MKDRFEGGDSSPLNRARSADEGRWIGRRLDLQLQSDLEYVERGNAKPLTKVSAGEVAYSSSSDTVKLVLPVLQRVPPAASNPGITTERTRKE